MKKLKRFLVFFAMFLLTLIDVPWAVFNVVKGGIIFGIGKALKMPKLATYGRNIALSVDQFLSAKFMGQDPDVTISMALGVAKYKHEEGIAKVALYWRFFYNFVNMLFSWQIDHVKESIEKEEKALGTVIHLYTDVDPDWTDLDIPGNSPETLAKEESA